MNPVNILILAAVIGIGGTWVKGDTIKPRMVLGLGFAALGISLIAEANEKIGYLFAVIVLLGVFLTTAGPLFTAVQAGTK
jgi:hypothetical protein